MFCTLVDGEVLIGSSSGVASNSIPNVRKVILTNVPIKGWVCYSYKYGLLDSPDKVLPLPALYAKIAQCGWVASGRLVVIYGRRCF